MEILNAEIENASIFIERGILTSMLDLKFGGGGQGFGGYNLSNGNSCAKFIRGILNALEVEKWEDLKGKYIRIKKTGYNDPIMEIGHITKDKWFNIKEDLMVEIG